MAADHHAARDRNLNQSAKNHLECLSSPGIEPCSWPRRTKCTPNGDTAVACTTERIRHDKDRLLDKFTIESKYVT